jgi:two-component system, LytTR family, sensor kinase
MSSIVLPVPNAPFIPSHWRYRPLGAIIRNVNASLLVNALGHSAGVLIFGIFLFLLIQDRAARRMRGSTKSMLAAALALVWNLASLIVLGLGTRTGAFTEITVAVSFSVLSLLPAVLFDLCLAGRQRALTNAGYALSGVAIVLHAAELFRKGDALHQWGLLLITFGFGALTCIAAAGVIASRDLNRGAFTSRLVGTMSLFLLAMSFVHWGGGHLQEAWSRELAFHHAAIPLALLVLLQDYRFILLDAFLRFLANVLLAGLFVSAAAVAWELHLLPAPSTPFAEGLLLVAACLVLVAFALLRGRVQSLLTRLVFRRPDVEALLQSLKTPVRDDAVYIAFAAAQLGEFMGTHATVVESDPEGVQGARGNGYADAQGAPRNGAPADEDIPRAEGARWNSARLQELDLRRPAVVSEFPSLRAELQAAHREGQEVEAIVPLRIASRGARYVLLGRRSGGRRYLSEDLAALARAASVIAEQVEQYRELEVRRLVAQAELRALQSQIHPHFLFNALNALYGIIPREARGARETVLNLADIFRYFLETRRLFLPLEEELRIVKAYLEVESLRLGTKLRTEIEVDPEALSAQIPVLSIQPLVENAVKHGISPLPQGGLVRIEARREPGGALRIAVSDTGAGFPSVSKNGLGGESGVGLENVIRRLELCYGAASQLQISSGPAGTSVSFSIPAASAELAAEMEAVR